ncbi:CAP-Gly domain-containing linker protein 1-like isoform X2 [Saccostrea echinata]|uniref:CAP-Gly domain-containing linker protein 1-like isoform X2 n=1 Tax=Saccostrea echinata TaxID=191078 RepID=UPI002A81C1CA|nr:CAP-Gly domain-containing linker protein 1-like isoform X2 [Saccostrea echinata]
MANFERKLPVPEGRHKEKRRSFLPTPKSFTSAQDVGQDHTKAFSIQEKTKPHLQVGDKICIGGIKLGELRYFGKTHIAAGLWCGIELYEKEGKHDGEVEGVRYFTCRPGHGIFAPVDKVSKIELVPHDLHGDVIEEETEVPPEDVPEQKTVITRPQRRLLPQPQIFARKDPKEKIAVPTKIDEQNEDFDEVDFLGTSASQEPVVIPGKRSLPKIDPKIRTPSSKLFPELYNEQVCNLSSKDSKQSAIYTTSLSADALNENKNLNNCIPHENKLSSTYTLPQSSAEPGFAAFSKPSKLPAPSKLPQAPTPSVTEKNCTMSDNKQLTTETSVTENIGNNTFLSGNLNKTYNVGEIQIPVSTDIHMTTQSSGEDSISGEVQECLSSDHRHFLNLTFDMEGGGSPPQPTSSTQNPQKVFDDLQPSSSADATFDISHNSSLGVLDIHDSQLNSDLLQGETENVLAGEKKSLLNLTDLEKLSKVSILSRRQDHVASLGETFEAENAITSTPNVSGGRLKPSVLSFSVQAKESQSKDKNALGDEDVDFDIPLNYDLNATYEVSEEGRPVEMLGADTLDWRSEASDGDEPSASSEDSAENKQMNRTQDQDQLRAAAQKEINQRVDSLTEKISSLGITSDTGLSQSSLSAPKPKLPMVDSGISEQGDILTLEQGRMADSCEMRQSMTDEKQNLYKLMEEKEEIQLQDDLIAGHLKNERPLSLVSSISADTGYVPDTDSERGTLTINSPLDWAEKMAQSSDSMAGVELTDLDAAYAQSFKNFQTAVLRGAGQVLEESDSDICSDGGTVLADNNDLGKEDSEFENMSTLLRDVKGISADDILPLSSEDKDTEPLVIGADVQQTVSDTVIEDERIEADQQLDKLNVTMDIVRESSSEEKEAEDNEEKKEEPDEENEVTVKEVSEEESADEGSVTIEETKPQKKKKKKEAEKVEHKKPNIKVGSRIADYIKAPVPVKPKDENTEAAKNKRNMGPKGKAARLNDSKTKGGKEEGNEERKKKEKVEKEPPKIIKRTPPKSKWDSIMSQIEADKNVAKPKSEVKSKLESYLSTPPPPSSKKETAPKEKPKKKLPTVPTPDFSKVKSKLNLGAPVALIRRESSPAAGKKDSPRGGVSGEVMRRLSSVASNGSSKAPKLDLNDSASSSVLGSAISSVRSSQSDLAGVDGGGESSVPSTPKTVQKPSNKTLGRISSLQERERRASTSSTMSTASQGSVKALNAKNSRISDIAAPRRKSVPAKGIVPVMSHQNRNKTKTKNNQKPANQQSDVISLHNKQEVTRLEALCESRTKELNYARLQMKSNLQAFDAMTVMVQYLSQDLDAFSNPKLSSQVKTLQTQLEETKQQIEELQAQKGKLDESILQLNKDHLDQINALKVEHEKQISWEKEKHEENLTNYRQLAEEYHCKEIDHIKTTHDEMIAEMKADNSLIIQKLKKAQEVDIAALRNKHEEQMEELHKQHRDRLEEITHRFENIKMGLSEKVETLRGECDDLRTRARASEEALLRDSDVKVQMALSPYKNLPQEIESLKLVIEIRNEEIQKLKNRNIELEKQAEELRNAKEKIIAQQQKIENLEAIISMKTDHEKQLHDKCQLLMRKCDKESKANKRLSMDFEELIYKVNLSDPGSLENLSKIGGSPSHSANSSPAVRRKNRSPAFGDVDKSPASQVYRRSLSSVENSAEKKMKRRSANFLYEKDGTSPTGSPRHRVKTYSDSCSPTRGLHTHSESDRMVHSCEGVPTDKPRDNAARLIQSCNDAEVFEAPQGLPAPVTPDDIKGGMEEVNQSSKSTSAAKTELVSMNNGQSPDNLGQGGVDLEEFEGESLHIDTKEDTSDLSHSTESYCPSEVTSGTGSLIWDYEKMDSIKSMDSSQTSQTSDSMLDSSTLTDTKVDNNTLTNIKDLTTEESDTSSGFVETGEILVTTTSPSDSRKESTV